MSVRDQEFDSSSGVYRLKDARGKLLDVEWMPGAYFLICMPRCCLSMLIFYYDIDILLMLWTTASLALPSTRLWIIDIIDSTQPL